MRPSEKLNELLIVCLAMARRATGIEIVWLTLVQASADAIAAAMPAPPSASTTEKPESQGGAPAEAIGGVMRPGSRASPSVAAIVSRRRRAEVAEVVGLRMR